MNHSAQLFQKAQTYIPGGVNSPVRAFKSVGGNPIFFKQGKGAYLIDEDNKQYIDYVDSWGPLILGHAEPHVVKAVTHAAEKGLTFGAATAIEVEIAEKICHLMPSIEMVRMVNSGTEATMTAIRLARGFTGRDKILKFEGCYHGHSDALLVKSGSGLLTFGTPTSAGVPNDFAKHTLTARFNDLDSVQQIFEKFGHEIAAIIVEPVAGNMNCVLPLPNFLSGLREICDQYRSILIFDEVITGFRVALGGAQALYQVMPDLTTLGKIIGGGMPVGAFGGKRAIMEHLAPLGPVYQAGTLSGNPVAMAAGLETLKQIEKPNFYASLEHLTRQLCEGLLERAKAANIPFTYNQVGSMFGLFFNDASPIIHYEQVMNSNTQLFNQFFHGMLEQGIYLAPSAFESGFVSAAHQIEEIQVTLQAAEKTFKKMKQ